MRQHFDQVGVAAWRSLLASIEGERPGSVGLIPTELVVRESSGPAR
ncbi:hypothetical protein [Microbacterium sp.]